jgi:hypothetical protein
MNPLLHYLHLSRDWQTLGFLEIEGVYAMRKWTDHDGCHFPFQHNRDSSNVTDSLTPTRWFDDDEKLDQMNDDDGWW